MHFFSRFNPLRPLADLRRYFHRRGPVELGFLGAALIGTAVIIGAFIIDTPPRAEKEKQIVYAQQWPLTRTDAEIVAQQKKDKPAEDARRKRIEDAQKRHQAELKRLDEKLTSWGL